MRSDSKAACEARRILVIGSGGAGKSTAATVLGAKLGLEVIHLDRHFYRPEWVPLAPEEWREKIEALTARENWVMDGDFSDSFEIRFPRAHLVVDLAYSRFLCLYRALSRLIRNRGRTRADLAEGCFESFDKSFLLWIWNYPRDNRPKIDRAVQQFGSESRYLRFDSPRAFTRWVESIDPSPT